MSFRRLGKEFDYVLNLAHIHSFVWSAACVTMNSYTYDYCCMLIPL